MDDIRLLELKQRAVSLYDSLMNDPDRPFWQVELTAIVLNHAEIMNVLASDLVSSVADLQALKTKLDSVQLRYSELLYKMSEK